MANFLLAYHGGGMPETEEEQAKVMAAWGAWYQNLGSAVVDNGNPTGAVKTIAGNGDVTDGGGANPVSGYSMISADNIEAATSMAKGCPILEEGNASIEVLEIVPAM